MMNEELITGLRHIAHTMERNGLSYHQHVAEGAIKALEQQPCEDAVSREAVNVLVDELARSISDERCCISRGRITATIMRDILHLPSVTPKYTDEEIDKAQAVEQAYVDKMVELAVEESKRPKGRWIKCKSRFGVEYFKCSECGRRLDWIDRDDNYCSNCGSDNSESTIEWFKDRDTNLAEISGGGKE